MSEAAHLAVSVVWGGARRAFLFLVDEWRAIDRELKVGPWVLEARLMTKPATADEVRSTLRIGLVGAGMPVADAERLVGDLCDQRPGQMDEALLAARLAVAACLHGLDDDVAGHVTGEPVAAERKKTRSRTAGSRSPAS